MAICATSNTQSCDELLSLLSICLTAAQQHSPLILVLQPLSFLVPTMKAVHEMAILDLKNFFLSVHIPDVSQNPNSIHSLLPLVQKVLFHFILRSTHGHNKHEAH